MNRGLLSAGWALWRTSLRQDRRKALTALVLVVAGAVAWPLVAVLLRVLFDAVTAGRPVAAFLAGVGVAVGLIAGLTLGHFAHIAYFELAELDVLHVHQELMDATNGTPGMAHFERSEFADKITVLEQDVEQLRVGLQAVLTGVGLAVAMTLTTVVLAVLHPLLLLLPLAAVPPLLAGRWAERMVNRAREAVAESTRRAAGLFRLATDAAAGKELRLFGLTGEVRRRHRGHWQDATRRLWRAQLVASLVRMTGQLAFAAGYVLAVLLILRDAVAGRRGVGDVILVVTIAAQVNQQVAAAVGVLQDLQRLRSVYRRLDEVHDLVRAADRHPSPADPVPGPVALGPAVTVGPAAVGAPPPRLREGIRLAGVTLRYPGRAEPVVTGLDLHLPAGATVAVVGENGAGKTTLVKLLCGLLTPTSGRILVDGVELAALSLPGWRERIAAGFQDFVRFELPARQTVGVGDLPRRDDDQAVRTALGRAGADDLVGQLDEGLDTPLGRSHTDGAELSGGQWQKLALGRAFMRDDPLLVVLDEPTAALDAEAEYALFARYRGQAREVAARTGAVSVFVSHRFSTVQLADLIVVLADGGVAEAGSHADLLAAGGQYAEMFELQARAYR
ncbi:ABC transporter ATP-binding protein [Micromonospora sp. HUAS LYJ1]|uniref:ABC transporter ATP-binding protein n=1 Tax=Micromonospora sp. HUAS LYJ1 TaxID=3061626 RepID=UPI0026741CC6|nr:ABC transporter ATP-binding protein [Micromonospora sp. HUAS LYJ1]WKU06773.1 ABC transporter ATP-binding protein [Micromonospora sp. HUAS LYJ1]